MDFRIYTSRYYEPLLKERADLAKVPISIGLPRWLLPYALEQQLRPLCPPRRIIKWTDQEQYAEVYLQQLEDLGIEAVNTLLGEAHDRTGRDLVLLCYEDLSKFWCHRTMFAEWYKNKTGIVIPELVGWAAKQETLC
jgi:hypothetical protein